MFLLHPAVEFFDVSSRTVLQTYLLDIEPSHVVEEAVEEMKDDPFDPNVDVFTGNPDLAMEVRDLLRVLGNRVQTLEAELLGAQNLLEEQGELLSTLGLRQDTAYTSLRSDLVRLDAQVGAAAVFGAPAGGVPVDIVDRAVEAAQAHAETMVAEKAAEAQERFDNSVRGLNMDVARLTGIQTTQGGQITTLMRDVNGKDGRLQALADDCKRIEARADKAAVELGARCSVRRRTLRHSS